MFLIIRGSALAAVVAVLFNAALLVGVVLAIAYGVHSIYFGG